MDEPCKKHNLIESTMISEALGRCINCGKLSDLEGETVESGDWLPECSGADYWNGSFECAYGYRNSLYQLKCSECKHGKFPIPIEWYPY